MSTTPTRLSEQAYNNIDCIATSRIYATMVEEDRAQSCWLFDQATIGPALTANMRGIRVDPHRIKEASKETLELAAAKRAEFEEAIGRPWDWGKKTTGLKPSPTKFAKLLYDEMGVKPRKNETGGRTVGKEAVADILEDPKTSAEARKVALLYQEMTVLEEDKKCLSKPMEGNRFNFTLVVSGTNTGRWVCKANHFGLGGNLQAFSKRIMSIFVPDPGYVFVEIDQKQGESKLVAYLAGCQKYKDWHHEGNVHVRVGQLIWPDVVKDKKSAKNTPLPWDPNKNYYDLSKRIQHAGNYGQSPTGMGRHLHVKVAQAKSWQDAYYSELPEIRQWQLDTTMHLKVHHFLTTPFGRRRVFTGRTWDNDTAREALAYVPQSCCSQANKIIMWRIWNYFDPDRAQILMEKHDGNLFQVREGDVETVEEILLASRVRVPIRDDVHTTEVEAAWGRDWGNMKEWTGAFD